MERLFEFVRGLFRLKQPVQKNYSPTFRVCEPFSEEAAAEAQNLQDRIDALSIDYSFKGHLRMSDYLDIVPFVIESASAISASDIHIEPGPENGRVRYRSDGSLRTLYTYNMEEHSLLINRIKVMAQLDIAEKRLPQDGRVEWEDKDLRVSSIPVMYGEKLVLRILRRNPGKLDLTNLGMSLKQLRLYRQCIDQPHGLILISGPTGSGKTTTLYASLQILNRDGVNIVTAEDPIEYFIPGISQVQVRSSIGLSFAATLRSFLRQDPDIIMIGEIRDAETVSIAVRAAMTGHLVLSTVHTNSAAGAINRLTDMGIANYLLRDTLVCSVAQRLMRLLCPECKKAIGRSEASVDEPRHFEAAGCKACGNTGYRGRTAVFEIIPSADAFPEMDGERKNCPEHDGPMAEHGRKLVDAGLSSPSEFLRVFGTEVSITIHV